MKYLIPVEHAALLNEAFGASYLFAWQEQAGGPFIHDSDHLASWPPTAPDPDKVIPELGLASSYPAYLASLVQAPNLACKIYRYLPPEAGEFPLQEPPFSIDYRVDLDRRLYRKRTFTKGTLTRVEYHAEVSALPGGSLVFSDLVVDESYVYVRDAAGFATERTLTITWYREDGTPHPRTKVMRKLYDMQASMAEGRRRRTNVVRDLEARVVTHLLGTYGQTDPQAAFSLGRDFIALYRDQISDYVAGSSPALYDAISADATTTWLDDTLPGGLTIRGMLLEELTL